MFLLDIFSLIIISISSLGKRGKAENLFVTKRCTWRVLCWRAQPGFEPGTSRTRSENHTPRPLSQAEKHWDQSDSRV